MAYCLTKFKMGEIIFYKFHKNLQKNYVKHYKPYMSGFKN